MTLYSQLSKIYPKRVRLAFENLLKYSGIKIDVNRFIGFIIFFGFGLSIALAFYPAGLFNIPYLIGVLFLFISFELLVYMWLVLKADSKSRFIEDVLPDALQLMSSNLRAGMTTDRALLLSARKEFGPLKDEINIVGREISLGKDISESLIDMAKRIRSDKLEKTMYLISGGIKSGGKLAELLDQTAKNLRGQKLVDEKVRSSVLMYVIFIFVATGIGAPILFGLSTYLVGVLTETLAGVEIPADVELAQNVPIALKGIGISPQYVLNFALMALIVSSIMGSFVIGLIAKGKEREGLKFLPYLMILSLTLFFLIRKFISSILGGFFGL